MIYWKHKDGLTYYIKVKKDKETDDVRKRTVVQLVYSRMGQWYSKFFGTVAAELIDDGNGFRIKVGKHDLYLDYGDAGEIYYLFREMRLRTHWATGQRVTVRPADKPKPTKVPGPGTDTGIWSGQKAKP